MTAPKSSRVRVPRLRAPRSVRPANADSPVSGAKTALVIVVEATEAPGVALGTVFRAHSRIMRLGLGDLNLNLPRELRAAVRASGQVADRLLKAVRKGFLKMVEDTLDECRRAANGTGQGSLNSLLDAIEGNLQVPNGFQSFLNLYGEAAFAAALRELAAPAYDRVVVLTDRQATFDMFSTTLRDLHGQGYLIDILLDVHGSDTPGLLFNGKSVTTNDVKAINEGQPLRLNAVYMVSCWGAAFNSAWRSLGAVGSNGSERLNYYVLLSPFVFLGAWVNGVSLNDAAERAYKAESALLNGRTLSVRVTIGRNPLTGERIRASVSIGVTWTRLMNKILSELEEDPVRPVNNKASSRRMASGEARLAHRGLGGEVAEPRRSTSRLPVGDAVPTAAVITRGTPRAGLHPSVRASVPHGRVVPGRGRPPRHG